MSTDIGLDDDAIREVRFAACCAVALGQALTLILGSVDSTGERGSIIENSTTRSVQCVCPHSHLVTVTVKLASADKLPRIVVAVMEDEG